MAQERISSVIEQSTFDELAKLQSELIATEKLIQGFDVKISDAKTLTQVNAALSEVNANTEKITKNLQQQQSAQKNLNAENKQNIQFQKELERQGKANEKTLLAIEKAKQREAKLNAEATSAYKILSKAYQDAALRAKDYSLTLGANHPITLQAIADAQAMDTRLKQLDATVGQHQRNVGNYNMVAAQFNQLLREMPNAALGMRTLVMSLSNNLGYFAESLIDARKQTGGLKGALAGMLSTSNLLVMGINIAVTALTFLGLSMAKSKEEAEDATNAYDDLSDALLRYADASNQAARAIRRVVGTSADDARRELELLQAKGASDKEIYEARIRYNKALRKDAATEMNTLNSVIQSVNELKSEYENAKNILVGGETQETIYRRTFLTPLAKVLEERLNLTEEQAKKEAERLGKNPEVIIELSKQRDEALQVYKDADNALLIADAEYQGKLTEQQKQALKDRIKALRQAEKEAGSMGTMPTTTDIAFQIRTEQYQQMTKDIEAAEIQLQKSIEQQYANGEITVEQYEEAKKVATEEGAKKRLQAEIEYLKNVTDLVYDPTTRAQMMERIQQAELEVLEAGNERKKRLYEQDEKNRTDIEKKANDKIKAERQALFTALQALSSVARDLFGIQSDQLAARIQELQREGQLIQSNGQAEIEKIKASQLSEEEKEQAIRDQLARTESLRIANEGRQRDAARKKAAFDKAAAISEITLNTAIAVIKAFTEGDPFTKGIRAAAAAAVGAAQLARAASAPVPQYEGGTLDHKGGKFIAGEKESELVIRPDGRKYWTADRPTMYNEPKGTKVLNSEMINAVLGNGMAQSIRMAQMNKSANFNIDELKDAIKDSGDKTVKAIHRNRAIQSVKVTAPDYYYQAKVKGKA